MYHQRIDDQDMLCVIEGSSDAPNECLCDIHIGRFASDEEVKRCLLICITRLDRCS